MIERSGPVSNDRFSNVTLQLVSKAADGKRARAMLTMDRFRPKQDPRPQPGYATRSDFCESLVHDLQPLYLLAFLLTGSHPEAEQCFMATVEDAFRGNAVFKGW